MNVKTKDSVKAALLLACAVLIPTAFHYLRLAGQIFLPMHIPVLIAGFMVPWKYAALCGFLAPALSFLITSMPPMPSGIVMMFELGVYGALASILYRKFRINIYLSLVITMLAGRFVSILGNFILANLFLGTAFELMKFINTLFVIALPGIIIQLIIVPVIVKLTCRSAEHKSMEGRNSGKPERVF